MASLGGLMLRSHGVLRSTTLKCRPALGPQGVARRIAMAATPEAQAEELRGMSCSLAGGCSADTPKVPADKLPELLAAVPMWKLSEDKKSISKKFVARNFVAAVNFFNKVVEVAEAEGHHPDLHLTGFRNVEVVLSTHAINDLAMADFVMASKIDALPVEYSPKWLKEQGLAAAGGSTSTTSSLEA